MFSSRSRPTAYDNLFSLCRGWSADELAQIHRIHIALSAMSMVFEAACGVTDEGDPWFAFCEPDGAVIVHIAIIDKRYQLFAPSMSPPLSGASLAEPTCQLLRAITRRPPAPVWPRSQMP